MSAIHVERVEKIKELAQQKGGLITTSQIEGVGISRALIPTFIEDGTLVKEGRGIYYYAGEFPDELKVIQTNNTKLIYSYATALYLWDMTDRIPHVWDITVPQGFNATRIKRNHKKIRIHYVMPEKWEIGITETQTPEGNTVRLYDKERCIIDIVKRKDRIDKQVYLQALHEYFDSRSSDVNKLIQYAKMFNIEGSIRDYAEIMGR